MGLNRTCTVVQALSFINSMTAQLFGRFTATNSLNIGLPPPVVKMTIPEPQIRGADRIFSFSLHQNEEAKKIIYCSKSGGTEHDWRLNWRLKF